MTIKNVHLLKNIYRKTEFYCVKSRLVQKHKYRGFQKNVNTFKEILVRFKILFSMGGKSLVFLNN
jgi:hypothetical protein